MGSHPTYIQPVNQCFFSHLKKKLKFWVPPSQRCLSGVLRPRLQRQRSRTCWIRSSVHELCSVIGSILLRRDHSIKPDERRTMKTNRKSQNRNKNCTFYYVLVKAATNPSAIQTSCYWCCRLFVSIKKEANCLRHRDDSSSMRHRLSECRAEMSWSKAATTTSTFSFLKSAADTRADVTQNRAGNDSDKRTASYV